MAKNRTVDAQHIVPDKITRIEISRTASSVEVTVRVFVAGVNDPHVFDLESMTAAIQFYESLWSLRTGGSDMDITPPCQ